MEVVNNKKEFRFEAQLPGGEYITLTYRWLKGSIVLMHTFVPAAAQGSGLGKEFVHQVLEYIRAQHLKMIVYCSFVAHYLKSHPEYNDLLDESHRPRTA